MPTETASPLQSTSVVTGLTVDDIQDSIAFYEGLGVVGRDRVTGVGMRVYIETPHDYR